MDGWMDGWMDGSKVYLERLVACNKVPSPETEYLQQQKGKSSGT